MVMNEKMPVKRSYANSVAIFVDDLEANFEDRDKCKPVMIIKSDLGKRIKKNDPIWKKGMLEAVLKIEKESSPMFFKESGISVQALRVMKRKLKDAGHPNIRTVFFDWDRTLSAFDGLFNPSIIPRMRKDGSWPHIRDKMFGGKIRLKLVVEILSMLQEQKRVQIVTNQSDESFIKKFLSEISTDFQEPLLLKVPIWAYRNRKKLGVHLTSKFAWLRRELGPGNCER